MSQHLHFSEPNGCSHPFHSQLEKYYSWLSNVVHGARCPDCNGIFYNNVNPLDITELCVTNKKMLEDDDIFLQFPNLKSIEFIVLTHKIPSSIATLKNLKLLVLCHLNIKSFPEVIFNIPSLTTLWFANVARMENIRFLFGVKLRN